MIEILADACSWLVPGMRGGASRRDCSLIWCQSQASPRPRAASFAATQPQCLSHSCYHHCLFTLNYCFAPRAQTPRQVLPVHASLSVPALTAITWTCNHLHTTGKSCKNTLTLSFFSSSCSLEIQLYSELNSTLGE